MNAKTAAQGTKFDIVLWILIIVLVALGIGADFYYATESLAVRLSGWLILTCTLVLIALQTAPGKLAWSFLREARMELRKVVWPTRQETVQTTLVVMAMVVVMALLLWGIDSVLIWAIGILTGQTG